MKFMHLSGVRLGLSSESGRRWGEERVEEVAESLERALLKADEEKVDLVLIAGGLFAHRPVTAELENADRIFKGHPGIMFIIVAGEPDEIRPSGPVLSYRWSENVRYVLSGSTEKISLPPLYTDIFARSFSPSAVSAEDLIAAGENDSSQPVKIGLLWESGLEKARDFKCSGFSYVALGGRGSHVEVIRDKAAYSGGLEPQGMTDQGEHGFYIGEVSPVTGMLTSLRFFPSASAAYVPLLIKVSTGTSPAELSAILEKEIQRRGAQNIYRLRIAGKKLPDTVFDLSEIRSKYRIAEYLDETEPEYDFEALFNEHRGDMIGYFISSITKNRDDLPEIDKKAMYLGIDALLRTEGSQS